MALVAERKTELIKEYQITPNDTGSAEVQVALLSERINYLTEHLKQFKKDIHTRHGLLMLVSKRRRLLKYLKRVDDARYRQLIERLNLRS